MDRSRGMWLGVIWVTCWLAVCDGDALAQYSKSKSSESKTAERGAESAEAAGDIRIRKITGLGNESVVKTPEFRSSNSRGVKEPREWGEIVVTFDTAPEWIDTLTLNFYVMTQRKDGNKKQYSFHQLVARYHDIERGKGHMAAVYLVPAALKRLGPIVAVGVEAKVNEAAAAVDEIKVKGGLPDRWWMKTNVIESDTVKSRDGYLKARVDTPFALVDFDEYEVSE